MKGSRRSRSTASPPARRRSTRRRRPEGRSSSGCWAPESCSDIAPSWLMNPYAATAAAITPTKACVITRERFHESLRVSPDLCVRFLAKMAKELRISEEQLLNIASEPVRKRLARLLLLLLQGDGRRGASQQPRPERLQPLGHGADDRDRPRDGLAHAWAHGSPETHPRHAQGDLGGGPGAPGRGGGGRNPNLTRSSKILIAVISTGARLGLLITPLEPHERVHAQKGSYPWLLLDGALLGSRSPEEAPHDSPHPSRLRSDLPPFSAVAVLIAGHAGARAPIRQSFFNAYPTAVGSRLDNLPSIQGHCGVCHYQFTGAGPRNLYGLACRAGPAELPQQRRGPPAGHAQHREPGLGLGRIFAADRDHGPDPLHEHAHLPRAQCRRMWARPPASPSTTSCRIWSRRAPTRSPRWSPFSRRMEVRSGRAARNRR